MTFGYSSLCDDFYFDTYVHTKLDIPGERDSLLAFFERIQRSFPQMCNMITEESGEVILEEDREKGQYRWVGVEVDRVGAGFTNPASIEQACDLDRLILELIPYMLGVSPLDIRLMDVTTSMDFDCNGDHNEVIAQALLCDSAFSSLLNLDSAKPIDLQPGIVVSLSDDCRMQARVSVESRTSSYEVRTGKYKEEKPITLSFTIRQYPKPNEKFDMNDAFEQQCRLLDDIMSEVIVPSFVKPISSAIAQRRK